MAAVPGAVGWLGSADYYPEERPIHQVSVAGFEIDLTPVTVQMFAEFVMATGYVTTAETAPDPADYPDADPAQLVPGSLVFDPPDGPVPLTDIRRWWSWTWRWR